MRSSIRCAGAPIGCHQAGPAAAALIAGDLAVGRSWLGPSPRMAWALSAHCSVQTGTCVTELISTPRQWLIAVIAKLGRTPHTRCVTHPLPQSSVVQRARRNLNLMIKDKRSSAVTENLHGSHKNETRLDSSRRFRVGELLEIRPS